MKITIEAESFLELLNLARNIMQGGNQNLVAPVEPLQMEKSEPPPARKASKKLEKAEKEIAEIPVAEPPVEVQSVAPEEQADPVVTDEMIKKEMARIKGSVDPDIVAKVKAWITEMSREKLSDTVQGEKFSIFNRLVEIS